MSTLADQVDVVIGVDTHRDTHSAAIVAPTGAEMQATTIPATKKGYAQLLKAVEGWPRAAAGVGDRRHRVLWSRALPSASCCR